MDKTKTEKKAAPDVFYSAHRLDPKALFFNLGDFANDTKGNFRFPTLDEIEKKLRALGIGTETAVVCYSNDGAMTNARVAVILSCFGVKSVKVLSHTHELEEDIGLKTAPKANG
jgi:3-mercaptopyruvate sulfurtransferase SseA